MDLHRRRADFLGHFRSKQLGLGGFGQARLARTAQPCGMQDQQACGIEAGLHVGQQVGHALVLNNGLVELHPVTGVGQRRFKGRAGNAQGLGGDTDAPTLQVGQGNGQTLAAFAQQVGFRHAALAEGHGAGVRGADAHLVFGTVHGKTWGVGGHQERRNALFAQLRVGHCKHNR